MSRAPRLLAVASAAAFAVGLLTSAAQRDGAVRSEVELTFADPEIVESSGLLARDDVVLTVNDSGDTGRVFVVDRATGETVGTTTFGEAVDVEALAPLSDGRVLVGDIGDNERARSSVQLRAVPAERTDQEVTPTTFELVYPDGARDAETLLVHPVTGEVVVVSKDVFGGTVYAAPDPLLTGQPNELEARGQVLAVATDGAFFPDGEHLIVRGYADARIYSWPDLETVGELRLPEQEQGEGVAVAPDGTVLLSTEGQGSDVLRVELPAKLRTLVDGADEGDGDAGADATSEEAGGTDADSGLDLRSLWPYGVGGLIGVVLCWLLSRALRLD